jgi:small-conductance mechanosensitive channel
MQINFKRYALYLLRWQASTPILAGVGILLAAMGQLVAAIVANLIGGLVFFLSRPVHLHVPVTCGAVGG